MPSFRNFGSGRAITLFLLFADQAFKCEPRKLEHSGSDVEIKTSFAALMAYLEYLGKKAILVLCISHVRMYRLRTERTSNYRCKRK